MQTVLLCFFWVVYTRSSCLLYKMFYLYCQLPHWRWDGGYDYPSARHVTLDMHGDVIKWKHFPRYWPFVRGIHRSPVNSPHKGQWRGALMFSLICAWMNGWVNNRKAGDLRRHCAHYDVTVRGKMICTKPQQRMRYVHYTVETPKTKNCHNTNIVVIVGTSGCLYDNLLWRQ